MLLKLGTRARRSLRRRPDFVRRLPGVNLRRRDRDCAGSLWLEKISPGGTGRKLPSTKCWLAFLEGYPSRLVRHSQDATFALRATACPQREGRVTAKRRRDEGGKGRSTDADHRRAVCETKSRMFRSSLAGRTSLFASFPALRTGLLSLSPSGTRTIGYWSRVAKPLRVLRGAVEMVRGFV